MATLPAIVFCEQVLMNDQFDKMVFLRILHQGTPYLGAMQFEEPTFRDKVFTFLQSHMGYSIKEIGDMDVPF
jgi:hypothetical protein